MKFLQLILILISSFASAQATYSITGNISLENEAKAIHIKVILYDEFQNVIQTIETENSRFNFENLDPKTYSISIIYNNKIQDEEPFYLNENKIFLFNIDEAVQIDEVVINGKKETFKIENGNYNIDVANSNFNKLATTKELFSKLPNVILGADQETLTIIGKGNPLLYLDDQQVDFSTISNLAIEDIKSIEIIKNPSAKYEANGKSVIKINLKKSKKEGLKLTLQETLSFKRKFNNYFNSTFQIRKNKSEFKLNTSYNQLNPWEGNGFDYRVKDKNIQSNYFIKSQTKRPHFIVNTNFFQKLNEAGDYLSFAIHSNFRKDKGLIYTKTAYSENNENQSILTLNDNENHRNLVNTLMNYNKNIKSIDASILTGLQYTIYNTGTTYDFYNKMDENDVEYNQSRYQKYRLKVFAGKFDVEKKFESDQKIEFGGRFTHAKSETTNQTFFPNESSEEFLYNFKELNLAAYLQYTKNYEKWNYKVGLRTETTNSKGFDEIKQLSDIDKKYIDWFPNAEINYTFENKNALTIYYKRTIDRPNYSNLSSGNLYGSPYIEYSGNFDIRPTYTNTFSANYSLKKWNMNVTYYQSKNPMNYTLIYDNVRNVSIFTTVNFEKEKNFSISLDVPFEYKFWSTQISLAMIYNKILDSKAILNKSAPYIYFYSNHNFKLGKDFNFMVDGYWLSKRTEGIYDRNSQVMINLGLTKSYKNVDFSIRFNDLFKQMKFSETLNYDKISSKNLFLVDYQEFSLGIKYNFGRLNKSISKENKVNEEENRIR